MKLIQKYGKKKIYIFSSILAVMCIIIGISTWYIMEQNYKQKVLDSIEVTFVEEASIEYGAEEVDYNTFIKEKIGEPEIQLPTEKINTKELEKKEVIYKVSKKGYSEYAKLTLEIKDTKAPEISIKEEIVTLEYGSDYDVKENIESVKDPIDGAVPYVETAEENNYYTVEGTVDTATSGDYAINIKAIDKNKTVSEKTYTVHVDEEQVEELIHQQPSGGGNNYTSSENKGEGNYTPPGNNEDSSNPPLNTCNSNGLYSPMGNSGRIFNDKGTADAWADTEASKSTSPWYGLGNYSWTIEDNCGDVKWTIDFY